MTGTIDPTSLFYTSNSITLHLDGYEASGSGDPIWFRVLPNRNWNAGEEVVLKVWTDKAVYKKEISLSSDLEFPNGGLTKIGVNVAGFIAEPLAVPTLWDFESDVDDWTFLDEDGDGNIWNLHDASQYALSGDYFLISESYINDYGPLTPDNWAITPTIQLTEGNYLSFWVRAQDPSYQNEHYAVYIHENSPYAEPVELLAETIFPDGEYVEIDNSYQHCIIQIPAEFDNKIVCIAFRHFNCTDWFWLDIDDVSVTEVYPYTPPTASYDDYLGDWVTSAENVYSITANEDGVSYFVTGFSGQVYPVEAFFEGNTLVIYDQVVYSDGSNEVAIQGLYPDGDYLSWNDYPVEGENRALLVAVYDDEQDILKINPKNSYTHYIWLNYVDQEYDSYGAYSTFPDVLVPYVPEPIVTIFSDGFENGLAGWTLFDADGDGNNWQLASSSTTAPHSGDYCLEGDSYISGTGALDPDNYAFTPAIELPTDECYLRYWVSSYSDSWPEHYAVYITMAEPAASIDNCSLLYDGSSGDSEFEKIELAIPTEYAGQTVYICFRHFESSDNWRMYLDDVSIIQKLDDTPVPAPKPKVAPKSFGGKYSLPELRKDRRPAHRGIPIPGLNKTRK